MVDRPRCTLLLLIICLFTITDIRNCSGNFSRSISSTPVGTTEIKNTPDAIACNTDETVSVAEIENKGDVIGLNTDGTLTVADIDNKTDAIGWNTVGTLAVADYNGSEQTTEKSSKNIVNPNAYTISAPSKYHSTNCFNVFGTRLYSDIEQTTRFRDVENLQSENAQNGSSVNTSPVDAVKEIVFTSAERNMFRSSLNKSWSPTTTDGMDYTLSTSTHRNIFNPSNSNSAESRRTTLP
jgi:hypothetical protein